MYINSYKRITSEVVPGVDIMHIRRNPLSAVKLLWYLGSVRNYLKDL